MKEKRVLVIGSGVAGMAAAFELAKLGLSVAVVEKRPFAGGHAIGFACKAVNGQCVRCGACMADSLLEEVVGNSRIQLMLGAEVTMLTRNRDRFDTVIRQAPVCIDASCDGCGKCLDACPEKGAIRRGSSAHHQPFLAIEGDSCLQVQGEDCLLCRKACPQDAIHPEAEGQTLRQTFDAVIGATGFSTYSPKDKPYGYGVFKDVVTNLDLEAILREHGKAVRPTDGNPPARMAFIQCVGSRDASRGRLWCSKFCCGSALRTAGLIMDRQPGTEVHVFYIDIQSFGKNFSSDFQTMKENIRFVRSIPADVYQTDDNRLRVIAAHPATGESMEECFDMVVLSAGIGPMEDAEELASLVQTPLGNDGFFPCAGDDRETESGVFMAGAACGPMSIAESVASGGQAAWGVLNFLKSGISNAS